MKYLKYFKTEAGYASFKNGSDYVLPNVSYVVETKDVNYAPKKSFKLRAKYNATSDNLVAFTGASNIKSLKVNGNSIKIEPLKNEIATFDVLGENISLDMETCAATFPESYLIKSPVSSWSFKAKDPNYVINENTYVCALGMVDGQTVANPIPLAEVMGYAFTTNDGVTLEATNAFLDGNINMQIQSGTSMCFTLCDMDTNSGTFVFIDTEHQINVTTGGLPAYSFDSEGLYDVEIELADSVINMQFAGTPLISIEIGDGITSIGNEAFQYCSGLTKVAIPDSVTSIGNYAFSGCTGLASIALGSGVTTIGKYAFSGCFDLTGELVIPDSVTSIKYSAFQDCSNLTDVTIGSGVTTIGGQVFHSCTGLTNIAIGSGVTTIGVRAFGSCTSLTSINIPDGVTSIENGAFQDCTGLTSVNIGSGVTTIGT